MELLNPSNFPASVASAGDDLKRIAEQFITPYCGDADAQAFQAACRKLDIETANRLLDQTVAKMSGAESVTDALLNLAEKFPDLSQLHTDLSRAWTDRDKVKVIDRYAKEMLSTMGR